MLASEQNKRINDVMNKIFGYINTNLNLKKDLDDYYNMAGISKDNKRQCPQQHWLQESRVEATQVPINWWMDKEDVM